MKKILILGGTQFIGRNLVERLLKIEEYEITLFNRQKTQSNLFPGVNKIKGDRETVAVEKIASELWDYVIDLSCFYPDSLTNVLNCINNLDKYILISTCSVYDNEDNHTLLRDEQSEILSCTDHQHIDRGPETYGNRKAECERILQDSGFPYTILRPALVYGKYDHSDRLYYWLYQIKQNETLLIPDHGERIFSLTYVLDLVETIIQALVQNENSEVYNVITTPKASIRKIVDLAGELLNKDFKTLHATPEFLEENNVAQWTDMPLWLDADHFTYNNQKLKDELGVGLTKLEKGIASTIEYYETLGWPEPIYGITEELRQDLIKKIRP